VVRFSALLYLVCGAALVFAFWTSSRGAVCFLVLVTALLFVFSLFVFLGFWWLLGCFLLAYLKLSLLVSLFPAWYASRQFFWILIFGFDGLKCFNLCVFEF
jgi:hypothetical protein